MEIIHCLFVLRILNVQILIQNVANVDGGRHHNHMNKKQQSEISPELTPDDSLDQPPTLPADSPLLQPGNLSSTSCIFNVSDCGAVGDGDTDETDAFKDAWKEACRVENGVVLVPSDQVFLVTLTIFPGPCEPGARISGEIRVVS
ncbi:polygalacturonase At1g48100-like [Primulina tabacum]|uniref:polygalacturonase At1g48100-like n=1 Tax=Primulina tabacum TaxID=48773 RepID=UPI003F5A9227